MARATRRRRPSVRSTKPKHNWANKLTRESKQRDRFLDKGKENYFRYDMEELLSKAGVAPEQQGAYIASLFAKGSRLGLEEAKVFADEKYKEKLYDADALKQILRLLDGYGTWR